MIETQLPMWLEVVRALGAGIGPVLLFLSALTAALIAWKACRQRAAAAADEMSFRQRTEADECEEWWRRTQWAFDYAADEREEKTAIGLAALDMLQISPLATADDRLLLDTLYRPIIAARASRTCTGTTASTAQRARTKRTFPWTRSGE
jgi:hypothetical protein